MRETLQAKNREVNRPPEPPVDAEADRSFMRMALEEAQEAGMAGEIPVGAVVVADGAVIARGGNETLRSGDPTAHAEIVALRAAAAALANHRLTNTTLYVTLEPCPMCAGAIAEARCRRIVYGAGDSRRGALEGAFRLFDIPGVNHRPMVTGGVLALEGEKLLTDFFTKRRSEQAAQKATESSDAPQNCAQ
ncbi:MAG TPA: tRNA adenosine(34) deaminase TadA [Sutterella wadsworthensis]|nr:tRNA adenosine(34) deaminase TadA [Sutterella wadsworthensis]